MFSHLKLKYISFGDGYYLNFQMQINMNVDWFWKL